MSETTTRPTWKRPYAVACLIVMALLVVAAVTVKLVTRSASSRPGCPAASEQLADVWEPSVRKTIEARFKAAELAAGQGVVTAVSEYAQRWERAHVAACALQDSVSAKRHMCLGYRRDELHGLTLLLRRTDGVALDQAQSLVDGLAPVEFCQRAGNLELLPAPPADVALARNTRELRARLAYTVMLARVGKRAQATAAMTELVAAARATGYEPIHAYAQRVAARLRARPR